MKRLLLIVLLTLSCSRAGEKVTSDEREAIRQIQIQLLVAQRDKIQAAAAEDKATQQLNSILSTLFRNHKLDPKKWQLNERLEFEEKK